MTDQAEDLSRVFKALGDPTRLAIFEMVRASCGTEALSARELANSVSEIAGQFDVSLSTVSHHLKELRNAGLVRCERRGQHVFCSIDPEALALLERFAKGGQG